MTDPRESPILTPEEVARFVDMPAATVGAWSRSTGRRQPVVHAVRPERRGWPSIPFFGLAEAHTARGLRRAHVSMDGVSRFATFLREQSGDRFALATPKLVTDGIDVFEEKDGELARLRDSQLPISDVIRPFLRELVPWDDDRTGGYRPLQLHTDLVEIDPRFNSGRMSFVRNRVPLFAVVGAVTAGDSIAEVAQDYRLTGNEVDVVERHINWLLEAA